MGSSPCVDAGTNLSAVGVVLDKDGLSRPLDGHDDGTNLWDLGAYEYIHPGADSDRDHFKDADEAAAGTDATNQYSLLQFEQAFGDLTLLRVGE